MLLLSFSASDYFLFLFFFALVHADMHEGEALGGAKSCAHAYVWLNEGPGRMDREARSSHVHTCQPRTTACIVMQGDQRPEEDQKTTQHGIDTELGWKRTTYQMATARVIYRR